MFYSPYLLWKHAKDDLQIKYMTRGCLLLFNGDDVIVPSQDQDEWYNYKNPDSMKLAWITKLTWQFKGWNVLPFRIEHTSSFFSGRLKDSCYPYNGFLPTLLKYLIGNNLDRITFTTTDVINKSLGFGPFNSYDYVCFNHTFSLAAGCITKRGCEEMIKVLKNYDDGKLPLLQYDFDEHVLRNYYVGKVLYLDYTTFAPNMTGKLIHFSRSTLQHFPRIIL